MVNFNHECKRLVEAFNIQPTEMKYVEKLLEEITKAKPISQVTWMIQRVCIDENLSENGRAYLIFTIGRAYEKGYKLWDTWNSNE